jgi:Homeobox KN domain
MANLSGSSGTARLAVEPCTRPVLDAATAAMSKLSFSRSLSTDGMVPSHHTRRLSGVISFNRSGPYDSDSSSASIQVGRTTSMSSIDSQKRNRDIFALDTDSESDTDSDESGDSADKDRRRRRRQRRRQAAAPSDKRLPRSVVKVLKRWLLSPEHYDYPYPDEDEKAKLMEFTGINAKQLNTWFTNARKRIWAPRRKKRGEPLTEYVHVPTHVSHRSSFEGEAGRDRRSRSVPLERTGTGVHDGGDVNDSEFTGEFSAPLRLEHEHLEDPFLTVGPSLVPTPCHAVAAGAPIAGLLCHRPPRITAPPKIASITGAVPLPPPPPTSGSLEFLTSPAGGISPFTMFRLAITDQSLLLSPDPLLEVTDECLSEEDLGNVDEEFGPGTLGSLGDADIEFPLSSKSDGSMRLTMRQRAGSSGFTPSVLTAIGQFTPSV